MEFAESDAVANVKTSKHIVQAQSLSVDIALAICR